jgi:hypothetical protein
LIRYRANKCVRFPLLVGAQKSTASTSLQISIMASA